MYGNIPGIACRRALPAGSPAPGPGAPPEDAGKYSGHGCPQGPGLYLYRLPAPFSLMVVDAFSLPVQFIPVQEADLPRINELSNIPEIANHFETVPPVPMETTYALWSCIQTGIMSLWGIHADGRIIGGAGFYSQPGGTRLSHAATFFLYIEPSFWGRGIGTRAIRFLEQEARSRGYLRMECMVAATNPDAIRLYERLGYLREGAKKQAFRIGDSCVDLVMMGKVFLPQKPAVPQGDPPGPGGRDPPVIGSAPGTSPPR